MRDVRRIVRAGRGPAAVPFVPLLLALLALLAFVPACNVARQVQESLDARLASAGYSVRDVPVDGGTVRVRVGGSGPWAVLIQGFGGDGPTTWAPQMVALAKEFRVVVPDILWFGGSRSTATPTLAAEAKGVSQALDAVGVGKAHVAGISYGGFVLLELARADPSRWLSAAIVASPGPPYTDADLAMLCRSAGVEKPEELFVPTDPEGARKLNGMIFFVDRKVPGFAWRQIYDTFYAPHRAERLALIRELASNRRAYPPARPAWMPGRTLLVWGREDRIFPVATGERLQEYLLAPMVVVPNAGHGVTTDAPGPVSRTLADFFAGRPLPWAEAR